MITLEQMAEYLNGYLQVNQFGDDLNGIYRPSDRPIQRLGLGLEPTANLIDWVALHQLDALFLHRPWKLPLDALPADLGVLAYHLAFDEGLTLGFNPRLAAALEMTDLAVFGLKQGRPIGMIGSLPSQPVAQVCRQIAAIFDGLEQIEMGQAVVFEDISGDASVNVSRDVHPDISGSVSERTVSKVVVVGAMTPDLVWEAAAQQADLYITGQFRPLAKAALQEAGLGVVAIGHRRCEEWGLRTLAAVLKEHWPALEVWMAPD